MTKLFNLLKKVKFVNEKSHKVVGIHNIIGIGIVNPGVFREFPEDLNRRIWVTPFGLLTLIWRK